MTGEADLAVQQISELKQIAGIEVVGAIPRELQTPAVFSAGRMAASDKVAPSDQLLRFLASPEVAPVLRESRAGALNLPALRRNLRGHEEAILPARDRCLSPSAAPLLAHAQSADLVLCDRVAADPSDPDKPADVKGVARYRSL